MSEQDEKVNEFLERVFQACMEYVEGMTCLTWHGGFDGNLDDPEDSSFELHIYEGLTELVGGKDDGSEVYQGYTVHSEIVELFGTLEKPATVGFCCEVGITKGNPEFSIEGTWEGKTCLVYFHAEPVKDAPTLIRQHPNGAMEYIGDQIDDEEDEDEDEDDRE